jgi:undecaprenyl-diphosphatase
VSSSGHLALVPRIFGWNYGSLPPEARKSFEVALHLGSAPALAVAAARAGGSGWSARELVLTLGPPAAVGLALEGPIERRLGGVRSVALAQLLAGAALLAADHRPGRRSPPAGADQLAVGLAQAVALVPGVSRSGAALTAARLRGLSREAAAALALRAALPVTAGAGGLKGMRALRGDLPADLRRPLSVGASAACLSAFASLALVPLAARRRFLRPLAAYRMALGAAVLVREARIRPK